LVVAETGIAALRSKCPRFDALDCKLEALEGSHDHITDVFDLRSRKTSGMGFV